MGLKIELAVKQDLENDAVIISKKLLREIVDKETNMTKNGFRALMFILMNMDSTDYKRFMWKVAADEFGYDKSVLSKGNHYLIDRGLILPDPSRKTYYKFKSYES